MAKRSHPGLVLFPLERQDASRGPSCVQCVDGLIEYADVAADTRASYLQDNHRRGRSPRHNRARQLKDHFSRL